MMGRRLPIPASANAVAAFHFAELCGGDLGAADYLALTHSHHTVILDGIPALGIDAPDVTRRFMTLVDVMYDHGTRLICAAEASPTELFAAGGRHGSRVKNDSLRTEGIEARLAAIGAAGGVEIRVDAVGGSSGSNTTMVGGAEWSATGLKGVSLGAYMGTSDIDFSKARTVSRLMEMGSQRYMEACGARVAAAGSAGA